MTADSHEGIPKARWVRIIPATILIYIVAYMDRMNISFAIAGGMNKELHLSMAGAGLAAGMFFIGYMLLQVPAGHIAEHFSAKVYIFWAILAWGLVSFLTGLVRNAPELMVMRFLLGVAEGGVYPALLVLVGKWFPAKEIGRANALFLMSLPLSTILTNPVSGWIVSRYEWRWLFFLEGGISLLLILVWVPMISDKPSEAKWISREEREYLEGTLGAERLERERAFQAAGRVHGSYKQLLSDKNLWLMVLIIICYTTGQYGYTLWLPTLLANLTKMSLGKVGWLTSLPFVAALGGLYLFGFLSDRDGNRRLWTALSLAGFAVALLAATMSSRWVWVSYGFLVFTGLFLKCMQSPFWAMPSLLFPPGICGGARGVINAVGNLGGFIGPILVGRSVTYSGRMEYGNYALVLALVVGTLLTFLLPKVTTGRSQDPALPQFVTALDAKADSKTS
ncbi:MAG TPA: MFS transporter [Acidisarcina sp.]|nr:MFS transporter [Acidisarcina sp.]